MVRFKGKRQMRSLVIAVVGLIVLAGHVPSLAVEAVVKWVDADRRLLTVTADGQTRTIRVPEGVKVLDVSGRELGDGLRAKDCTQGARVTLSVQPCRAAPTAAGPSRVPNGVPPGQF